MSFFSFKSNHPRQPPPPIRKPPKTPPAEEDPEVSSLLTPRPIPDPISNVSLINPNLQPEKAVHFAQIQLPQSFTVRFLGVRPATGIWGIQHTRRPTDELVEQASHNQSAAENLTLLELEVTEAGVTFRQLSHHKKTPKLSGRRPIERISYGVQDVVHPRVFSMIYLREKSSLVSGTEQRPFDCYVFHCEHRIQSRKLAYCLAKAFRLYGERIKAVNYMQTLKTTIGGDNDDEDDGREDEEGSTDQSTVPVSSSSSTRSSTEKRSPSSSKSSSRSTASETESDV